MKEHADLSVSFDVTSEISDICPYDCVKVIWGTTSDKLTLVMIQLSTPDQAEKASQNLQSIYQSFGNKYFSFSENNSQWSGELLSQKYKAQWAAVDTQGSILIFSSYRKVLNGFVADIDGYFYRNMVESLTSIQKQKLHQATRGIPIVIKHCFVKLFVNNETFDSVVESLELYSSEIVQFSFKELLRQIETLDKEKVQLNILMLLELTNIPLMVRQISEILEVEEIAVSSRIPTLVDFQCLTRMPYERNEKYFINPEIRLLTRALTRNYQELSNTIKEKVVRNFSENRQLEYTIQEAEIISVFDSYISDRDILDAEDFINSKLKEFPQSIILKYYYANYLKDRKKNEKAIDLLNSIRTPSGNQPAILRLLIECYITSTNPRYEEAEIFVEALEKISHHNDANLCLICEFYVEWSKYVKQFSVRGNKLEEIQRREKYKALARNALLIIDLIQKESHKLHYWRSAAYFNIWDNERALSYIDKAIELAMTEGSMDVVTYENHKNDILAKRQIYNRR